MYQHFQKVGENNYYNINNKRQGTLCLLFLWKGKNMKIIEPKIEIEKVDYNKIMKNLERACRTCYRSEDKITEDSYKILLKNCINRGHESILEQRKNYNKNDL